MPCSAPQTPHYIQQFGNAKRFAQIANHNNFITNIPIYLDLFISALAAGGEY
jgi:hypothetical protein